MELLSPAGNWSSFIVALANGADAVYLGGKDFSARQGAENLDTEEIKAAMDLAHLYGRKVYITVNTLVKNQEFQVLLDFVWILYAHGADGLIVQDLGFMNLLRKLLPDLPLHASTQMTVHNEWGAQFLVEQSITQVVLARELSLKDICKIHQTNPALKLEVFVHGALCYAYSGQCLFSSMVGGRSGNRGCCAQPCRMVYKLAAADLPADRTQDRRGHLMSTSDLCLLDYLADLEASGVQALKIEGRMKRPEYVATVTRIYRQALDQLPTGAESSTEEQKKQLAQIFNRNFTSGYLFDRRSGLLSTKRPNNRGVYIGRVIGRQNQEQVQIKLAAPLLAGDGIEIWVAGGKGPAFTVNEMYLNGQQVSDAPASSVISLKVKQSVQPNDRVFKTHDAQLLREAQDSARWFQEHKIPLYGQVFLKPHQPLRLILSDGQGCEAEVFSTSTAATAEKHPLRYEDLYEKLSRLGDTAYYLAELTFTCDDDLIIPFGEINAMRRQAVTALSKRRLAPYKSRKISKADFLKRKNQVFSQLKTEPRQAYEKTKFSMAVSNIRNARIALAHGMERVYLYADGLGTRQQLDDLEALARFFRQYEQGGSEIVLAWPHIQKNEEMEAFVNLVKDLGVKQIMVGNLGALQWCRKHDMVTIDADYSFNVFNLYGLQFLQTLGVRNVCLSPELNLQQLTDFAPRLPVELLVHGEIQLMVGEYCIMRHTLGHPDEDCKKYCRRHSYYVEDEKKYRFPVDSDVYCRNYIFNSRPLYMLDHLQSLSRLNPAGLRIEARRESEERVAALADTYVGVWRRIQQGITLEEGEMHRMRENLVGSEFTRGHYFRGVQ